MWSAGLPMTPANLVRVRVRVSVRVLTLNLS